MHLYMTSACSHVAAEWQITAESNHSVIWSYAVIWAEARIITEPHSRH